jgi:hypothetical protein
MLLQVNKFRMQYYFNSVKMYNHSISTIRSITNFSKSIIHTYTYIPLTLYPWMGTWNISDIPLRTWATFYQNDLAMRNTLDVAGGKPIAVWLQPISGGNTVNHMPFTTSMEEKERCYSFVLSRAPHEMRRQETRITLTFNLITKLCVPTREPVQDIPWVSYTI